MDQQTKSDIFVKHLPFILTCARDYGRWEESRKDALRRCLETDVIRNHWPIRLCVDSPGISRPVAMKWPQPQQKFSSCLGRRKFPAVTHRVSRRIFLTSVSKQLTQTFLPKRVPDHDATGVAFLKFIYFIFQRAIWTKSDLWPLETPSSGLASWESVMLCGRV